MRREYCIDTGYSFYPAHLLNARPMQSRFSYSEDVKVYHNSSQTVNESHYNIFGYKVYHASEEWLPISRPGGSSSGPPVGTFSQTSY